MENVFLHASFALLLVIALFVGGGMLLVKVRMEKNERQLRDQLIEPCGAGVSHGMVRRGTGRGVVQDSQPSLSWYTRLFDSPF